MRFITRLLSVSTLGLAIGLATAGAASANTTGGLPACQGGYSQSQCCQAPNWNLGQPPANPWENGQNPCCQPPSPPGQDNDHPWGMGQGQCCPFPGSGIGLFAAFNHGANCPQPLQCVFPPKHHKHHHKHHKHHHKHHKHHKQPGMFCQV